MGYMDYINYRTGRDALEKGQNISPSSSESKPNKAIITQILAVFNAVCKLLSKKKMGTLYF